MSFRIAKQYILQLRLCAVGLLNYASMRFESMHGGESTRR